MEAASSVHAAARCSSSSWLLPLTASHCLSVADSNHLSVVLLPPLLLLLLLPASACCSIEHANPASCAPSDVASIGRWLNDTNGSVRLFAF